MFLYMASPHMETDTVSAGECSVPCDAVSCNEHLQVADIQADVGTWKMQDLMGDDAAQTALSSCAAMDVIHSKCHPLIKA